MANITYNIGETYIKDAAEMIHIDIKDVADHYGWTNNENLSGWTYLDYAAANPLIRLSGSGGSSSTKTPCYSTTWEALHLYSYEDSRYNPQYLPWSYYGQNYMMITLTDNTKKIKKVKVTIKHNSSENTAVFLGTGIYNGAYVKDDPIMVGSVNFEGTAEVTLTTPRQFFILFSGTSTGAPNVNSQTNISALTIYYE